uniref:Doublecortin domain-containing protein n=1 Tax=Steinernema glaseri TaxID=37863 RepID=A0A1I7XXN1_9BILA
MALIPASYDPFANNISFLEINKRRRGESDRREEDRIYNRRPPAVKKIFLRRNDDFSSKPKRYIWKPWQTRDLHRLVADVGSFLGVEARELYDESGRKITDIRQIGDGATYTVVGDEHFDRGAPSEASSRVKRTKSRAVTEDYERAYREAMKDNAAYSIDYSDDAPPRIKSKGWRLRCSDSSDSGPEATDFYEDDWSSNAYIEQYYRSQPTTAPSRHTDPGRLVCLRTSSRAETGPSRAKDDSVLDYRVNRQGAGDGGSKKVPQRNRARRPRSAVIYNRRDQTHPEANIIYVFLNGRGIECRHVRFQKAQLQRGFNYILELIARGYSVNPGRLCTMDGKRIRRVEDLITRGAYILVPVGQNFRDTWYFLPDNAIDTSSHDMFRILKLYFSLGKSKTDLRTGQGEAQNQSQAKKGGVIPSQRTRQPPQPEPLFAKTDARKSRMSEYENGRQSAWEAQTPMPTGGRRSYSVDPPRSQATSSFPVPPKPV